MNIGLDIQIEVQTKFAISESDPSDLRFFFVYEITIRNKDSKSCQLLRRHWDIQHGEMKQETVDGDGVIGLQPWIKPGEEFSYRSACILETEYGSMKGYYVFQDEGGAEFQTPIDEFFLVVPRESVN